MKLLLERIVFLDDFTRGRLLINDEYFCDTIEDRDRRLSQHDPLEDIQRVKVHGKTAIPAGTYEVFLRMSNRFKKELPALKDVPGFEGVLIHSGNTSEDTEGCILVGECDADYIDRVINSRETMKKLMERLKALPANEYIEITIKNQIP